ncbi:MAG: YihA family ribosome biogenesis GTP-binding protein [Aquificaceae bacterium]|nr:MAG: YihA family ribosome biogenesis GTP-binding protein [Aquificaceae bacterium]
MRVEFVKSVYRLEDLPETNEPRRDIVFVGRSNVGKSSLLNMLVGRNIARVGKTPGRTRSINYFRWDFEGLRAFLVDLPGYGFAKGDRREIENWKKLIEGYFRLKAGDIALVLVLIDAKVGPMENDKALLRWLKYLKIPFEVVLTKTDKATQKELAQTEKKLKALGVTSAVRTSAKEGQGKEKLLKVIAQALRGG